MLATRGWTYMPRRKLPDRRNTWRRKVTIVDSEKGERFRFFVDFGEYDDNRLAEIFIVAHKCGDSFTRGVMDSLARTTSLALQSGTSPHELAHTLSKQNFPPCGEVVSEGSAVTRCTSLADYIAQEIVANYDADGVRIPTEPAPAPSTDTKPAGYTSEPWREY